MPGIYSIRPYTQEEIVSRDFILDGKPDGIINIVDATNIERNLYLTLQLLELRIPMVVALNMMDEVRVQRRLDRCATAHEPPARRTGRSHRRGEERRHIRTRSVRRLNWR